VLPRDSTCSSHIAIDIGASLTKFWTNKTPKKQKKQKKQKNKKGQNTKKQMRVFQKKERQKNIGTKKERFPAKKDKGAPRHGRRQKTKTQSWTSAPSNPWKLTPQAFDPRMKPPLRHGVERVR